MVLLDADPFGLAMCVCANCSSAAARKRDPASALGRRLLAWLRERIFAPNHRSPALVPVRVRDGKKNRR